MRADADRDDRTIVERRDPLFGAIYRANDLRTGADIALKVLHPKLANDPMVVERFRREGATLANLRDPHTIKAYELGEAADGTLYIVMELLYGESLYHRFRAGGPLSWRRVVHIARGVCSSLAEAHAAGIVHRDLKPANIHLETRGSDPDFVKVLDFGIAKIMQGGNSEQNELTQAGQMIGTLDYMSPEQMVGGELTGGSDIYTLGVVMYEMISGRTPFADAQTATAVLGAVLTQTPDRLSQHATVPAMLDHIVARCLERDARMRFDSVSALADALAALTASESLAVPAPVTQLSGQFPLLGFEHTGLTSEVTRIDVRRRDSSEPVLDARGPRHWPADARASVPAPLQQYATPSQVPRALGSNHGLHRGGIDRRSHARLDLGWQQPSIAQPGLATPGRAGSGSGRGYDMAAAANQDALVRRIIWIALLVIVALLGVMIAIR